MDPTWLLYAGIFIGPFIQEDAAVIAAATLSSMNTEHFPFVYFVILAGLILSDIWKYWIGYSAHAHPRFRRWASKKRVAEMGGRIERNAVTTLFIARFLPLARVPAYIACGYFKMSYAKFCAIVAASAVVYVTAIFAICHWLGELFGDRTELIIGSLLVVVVLIAMLVLGWRRWMGSGGGSDD
jgi:membrane protein DedA with SNARE-associated domain